MNDYSLCGWRVRSDIVLPELPQWIGEERAVDVVVRLAPVPGRLEIVANERPFLQVGKDGDCLIEFLGTARYLVSNGNDVSVAPCVSANSDDVRLFLFGTVFGILCHQRGLFPLHASCVDIFGQAVVLAGPSGAGKSTLAAALVRRGHRLLSDDVCVVDWCSPGGPRVLPTLARFKLWSDSMQYLGLSMAQADRVRPGLDKFSVPEISCHGAEIRKLAAVYLLTADARLDCEPEIERIYGLEVLEALVSNVYRRTLGRILGGERRLFEASARISEVPVHRLRRGKNPAGLFTLTTILEQRHGVV